jgi:hypothetical protein
MAKKRSRKPSKADPLKVEFSLRGTGKIPTAEQARAIFIQWAEGKRIPSRFKIKFVRWQNPGRATPALRNWREANTPAEIKLARETLHLRGWLSGAQIGVATLRVGRLQGKSAPHPTRLRQRKRKPTSTKKLRSGARSKNARTPRGKRSVPSNKKRMARSHKRERKTKRA